VLQILVQLFQVDRFVVLQMRCGGDKNSIPEIRKMVCSSLIEKPWKCVYRSSCTRGDQKVLGRT